MAGHDGELAGEFAVGAFEVAAAGAGVFAFGVFADDVEVDVGLGAAGERGGDAGHEAAGAQVHVLVEGAADGDEQAPEGDVVGDAGEADGAEEDAVAGAQFFEAVVRHHGAGAAVGFAGPVVVVEGEGEAEAGGGGVEDAQALGDGLAADAVAGDDGDAVGGGHVACPPGLGARVRRAGAAVKLRGSMGGDGGAAWPRAGGGAACPAFGFGGGCLV